MRETSHGSSRTRVYGAATALAGVLYVTICIAAASLIAGCRPAMPSALAPSAERIRTGHSSEGLFYESSGGGEPLVLIHGFSLDRRMWDPQVEVWQDEYHVLRYDLRGHGRSAPPVQPYSAHEDLRQLLDELGIERPTLIGLSAGSEVAINFAISYPDRVERLVLAAPELSGYALPPMPWFRPVAEALSAGQPERAARLWAHTPIMTLSANKESEEQLHGIVRDNWRV